MRTRTRMGIYEGAWRYLGRKRILVGSAAMGFSLGCFG